MQSSAVTENTPRRSVTELLSKLKPLLSGPRRLSTSRCEGTGARIGGGGGRGCGPRDPSEAAGLPDSHTLFMWVEKPQIFVANGI